MANDFSKGPVWKCIVTQAIPLTMAQMVHLLYNIVDRIYIGHLPETGSMALTGVGLTFPVVTLIAAFTCLFGMGGTPLFSIARGAKEDDEAERIMGNVFALLVMSSVLLFGICYLFRRPILFLFGAALATVISQCASAIWVLCFLTGKRTVFSHQKALLTLKRSNLKIDRKLTRQIMGLGAAGFFMQGTNCLVQVVCNATLQNYGGDLYVGVMTVLNSVREVLSLPINGITSGAQPVMGFNFGAKDNKRVKSAIKFTSVIGFTYTLLAWIVIMLIPLTLFKIFSADEATLAAGPEALNLYFFGFFFMAFQFSGQSVFQALGYAKKAVFFSLFRKAIIVVPLTILLPMLGLGVSGVFLAEPISNAVGGLACFMTMYRTVYRKL